MRRMESKEVQCETRSTCNVGITAASSVVQYIRDLEKKKPVIETCDLNIAAVAPNAIGSSPRFSPEVLLHS